MFVERVLGSSGRTDHSVAKAQPAPGQWEGAGAGAGHAGFRL